MLPLSLHGKHKFSVLKRLFVSPFKTFLMHFAPPTHLHVNPLTDIRENFFLIILYEAISDFYGFFN